MATGTEITWTLLSVLALLVCLRRFYLATRDYYFWLAHRRPNGRRGIIARMAARAEALRVVMLLSTSVVGANAMIAGAGVPGFLPSWLPIPLLFTVPVVALVNSIADERADNAVVRLIAESGDA